MLGQRRVPSQFVRYLDESATKLAVPNDWIPPVRTRRHRPTPPRPVFFFCAATQADTSASS